MTLETALPTAPEATASGQPENAELPANTAEEGSTDTPSEEGEKTKPEKSELERERDRLRRGIDRRTRREAEARAEAAQLREELLRLKGGAERNTNAQQQDDEPLTLSRAELAQMVKSEAAKLAPTLKQEQAEIEHRKAVIEKLAKDLGTERFDALADDLDEALGGIVDSKGRPKPATDAVFAADDPQAVIQYLADPDNADEAESIGRMDPIRAGRAIAKLEGRLEQAKAAGKPQRSKAPEPVEPASRGGGVINTMPDPKNVKAYIKWANEQDRRH
tara:strand:- start:9656 stop:10483 length:828 start_codon:yes stop_codon:yes gene_type:complete